MKSYFSCILWLLVAQHGADSEAGKICVFKENAVKLFSNVALDILKGRWALYVNGAQNNTHIATWKVTNHSIDLLFKQNNKIYLDPNKNIWIIDVDEKDEGKYSIKYTQDNSDGPSVELYVFESTEIKQFQECKGDLPKTSANYDAPINASIAPIMTTRSILTTTLNGQTAQSTPAAEMSLLQSNGMIVIVSVMAVIMVALVIAVLMIIYCLYKKLCSKPQAQRKNSEEPTTTLHTESDSDDDIGELKHFIDLSNFNASTVERFPVVQETTTDSRCKFCHKNIKCMICLPCGHLVMCEDCAKDVGECPQCKKAIMSTVKGFCKSPNLLEFV